MLTEVSASGYKTSVAYSSSDWVTRSEHNAIRRINSFSHLKEGWDFGRGKPSPAEAVANAKEVLRIIVSCGIPKTDAFPGIDGEIIVTGYLENDYFECVVRVDGYVDFLMEQDDNEVVNTEGTSLPELPGIIQKSMEKQWRLSGLFTRLDTTKTDIASKVPFLSQTAQTSEFQFLMKSVGSRSRILYAST